MLKFETGTVEGCNYSDQLNPTDLCNLMEGERNRTLSVYAGKVRDQSRDGSCLLDFEGMLQNESVGIPVRVPPVAFCGWYV